MLGAIVFCSLILLVSFSCSDNLSYPMRSSPRTFELPHLSLKEKIMIKGLIFGQKPRKKDLKKAMKNLNIHHLFTPSGLHLSSLLWFFSLFSLKRIPLFILFPLVVFIEGFFAFKRVYFIKLLGELLKMKNVHVDGRYLFFFVFTIEFVFRIHLSPLSFTYSFLFLGIIYSLRLCSPLIILVGLWFAQSLIISFTSAPLYLLALPLNSAITFLVMFLYPVILLNALIPLGLCDLLYDLILLCNYFLGIWDIQVNAVQSAVLLAMVLMKEIRKLGVAVWYLFQYLYTKESSL